MSDLDQHSETASLLVGDCLSRLREIPDGSARCCVTSPPYWGLRDYGVEGQLGLEQSPYEYVANIVAVFREVRRVLADDGTLWLNLGDSYIGKTGGRSSGKHARALHGEHQTSSRASGGKIEGLKPKDLVGIPWMTAFALRGDGWYLRSDIIWHKPNVMPESVKDRPTKGHEYIFLFSKDADYYYNADAIREPHTMKPQRRLSPIEGRPKYGQRQAHTEAGYRTRKEIGVDGNPKGRNKRTVWSIGTKPFKGAHFAVFPPALVEPCVLAGSQPGDIVLDPFTGSGTTGMVAREHGRRFLGVELNPDYAAMAWKRISNSVPSPQLTNGVTL